MLLLRELRGRLSLRQARAEYLESLCAEGRRPWTVRSYAERLGRFLGRFGDGPPELLDESRVRQFLRELKVGERRVNSDIYVEGHRKALTAFANWLVREGRVKTSPLAHVRPWKCDRTLPKILEPEEIVRLLGAWPRRGYEAERNRAIVALVYDTGLRVSDLVTLGDDQLDLERGRVRLLGKGRRERWVPVSPKMRAILGDYRLRWPRAGLLFTSYEGRPLSPNAVRLLLNRAARRVGLGRSVGPHAIRHSFATQYIRNGGKPAALQHILGHSTSAMTARYVHLAESDVRTDHSAASPLERL